MTNSAAWQFWIDVGGTFTDCIARREDGLLVRQKVLSSAVTKGRVGAGSSRDQILDGAARAEIAGFWNGYRLRLFDREGRPQAEAVVRDFHPDGGRLSLAGALDVAPAPGQFYELDGDEDAPILAVRRVLGLPLEQPLPRLAMRLGTTRGTNALLTRQGARTAWLTTRGFGDILAIGYQNRPRLFELAVRKTEPLHERVVEIDERVAADGQILLGLDLIAVRAALSRLRDEGIESLAVCLMHAYRQPCHEREVGRIARELGFDEVSLSSEVAPTIRIVARGDTTVVSAYLNPVLRSYVQRIERALGAGSQLRLLTSAGGLARGEDFTGQQSILSGPAGGVVGFSRAAREAGFEKAIGLDMGGTSTDVARFDGRFDFEYESEKAGVRVVTPMLAIETVAAGGGSICNFDGVKLVVGPASAGADPGPACHGRGGPLTVTDLNLYLGRLLAEYFPFPLDVDAVEERLTELVESIARRTGVRHDPRALADGFLRIASSNMANAIRSISIAKGYDPRDYVLVAFGGAAPQHACAIADELGIRQILIHADASVLSAFGIGAASVTRHAVRTLLVAYDPQFPFDALREELAAPLRAEVAREIAPEGISEECISETFSLDLRYQRTDASLTIARPLDGDFAREFRDEHRRRYGYEHLGRPLEVVAARIEVTGGRDDKPPANPRRPPGDEGTPAPSRGTARRRASEAPRAGHRAPGPVPDRLVTGWFVGEATETRVFLRSGLEAGDTILGPALIIEENSTTVVEPGWAAERLSGGEILLSRAASETTGAVPNGDLGPRTSVAPELEAAPDPVLLEVFHRGFTAIAEQMGITLRSTSSSVNVKERLDFSCALFTATGDLVVNAPHIPVHLGAMSETVRCVLHDNPAMRPGDVFVTNDPYRGGSHLPDITVVTPVHDDATGQLRFFTASRAHHAEIGGSTPGSMPPFSKRLDEEGVLIRNFKVVDAGRSRSQELRELLLSGPHPTRAVEDNLADLSAQIAANRQGARDLDRLVRMRGWALVAAYMKHIQAAAEYKTRTAIRRLANRDGSFTDHLDDGEPITARIQAVDDALRIDFTGTGPVLTSNLNANRAIVTAAVLYVLRCLIDEEIPLNQGVLVPVTIVLPECLLNPPGDADPARCAAVAGGNVETSQRVVDVLLGALGLAAASQGTMNNVLFGDATFGYYETICGGVGATRDRAGADAVHTHMTNTRITDPELLEQRFPVRLHVFEIRRGSGGAGQHRGGHGARRTIEFLRELELSILSQRRGPYPPYGIAGGQPGALGLNRLLRRDGTEHTLPARARLVVHAGDRLTIETPGGGGFGRAK